MKRFIFKIVFFLAPLGLLLIFPFFVIIVGREYYLPEAIVNEQFKDSQAIFCLAYGNVNKQYKESLLARIDPEITAIGTSRIGQIRSDFFAEPAKFANGANIVANIDDIYEYAKNLPEKGRLRTVILGLDQEMFFGAKPAIDQGLFERFGNLLLSSRTMYEDYFRYRKFTLDGLSRKSKGTDNIGLIALMDGRGYRKDGSFDNGKILDDPAAFQAYIRSTIEAKIGEIESDRGSFLYKEEIDEDSLKRLDAALKIFKAKGVSVIGFMSPYPHAFYRQMMSVDDAYKKAMLQSSASAAGIFAANSFGFGDFSDISALGASDGEFSDINHGTDKLYLRLTIYLAERNKELGRFADLSMLKKLLADTKGDYL